MKFLNVNSLFLLIVMVGMNSKAMAQKEGKYREVKINKSSEVINVSSDSLWNIVKEFDNVGIFFTGIDHAEGYGEPQFEGATCDERTCYVNIKGYSQVHEKLILFNPETHEMAYQMTKGGPPFLIHAQNHWTIESVGPNQCVLHMEATMRLKRFAGFLFGRKLERIIHKELPLSMNELKIYAETGEVSEAKKARMAEIESKKKKRAM